MQTIVPKPKGLLRARSNVLGSAATFQGVRSLCVPIRNGGGARGAQDHAQ